MSALDVNDPANSGNSSDNLYQIMKAVEAAEVTIRHQVELNERLRIELQRKTQELEKVQKSGETIDQSPGRDDKWDEHANGSSKPYQSVSSVCNNQEESHAEGSRINGMLKVLSDGQSPLDNGGFSQFSSPSTSYFFPSRYQIDGKYDPRFNLPGHGVMTVADVNNTNLWKQIQEHEQEIMQLRKHLGEYCVKEAQIHNEKLVLEKRIAYMRMAFDQQQQDLVDAASKALSYRQDIIEENIRLTYALQDAQQEKTTFISSLLPLLAEYSMQPQVSDAQSIASNIKVLFKHLHEKLVITEEKLKESHYQLTPWHSDIKQSNFPPTSPFHTIGSTLPTSVPNDTSTTDWDILGHHQSTLGGFPENNPVANNPVTDDSGRYSPPVSRTFAVHDLPTQLASTQNYSHETFNKQVTFSDPVTMTFMDDRDMEDRQQIDREPSTNWDMGNPPITTFDDPNSTYSPYLPPVLEEPSSFSEAADDDPLPAIEGLQISGEAFPGSELQACGYSINGTTSCNFEWVRHLENGSVNYIEGAKQPNYLITADDVDAYLAIEVQPLDNRKRKGELVKVFANDHRKITCDPEMHQQIQKTLYSGHGSYRVLLSSRYLDIWEPATLSIKRDGYSIKCSAPSGLGVTEKFSSTTRVVIPCGSPSEFSIMGSGVEHMMRVDNGEDISCSRDTIALTTRLFTIRATEKRKGKKKGLFFNKVVVKCLQ